MLNKSSTLFTFTSSPERRHELQSAWGGQAAQEGSFSLGLYLEHLKKPNRAATQPACQERKAPGKHQGTVQIIPYAWAQIHALLQKFKGIEIRCFDWPHYIQRDHLQKLRSGSKLLPSPGLGFWFELLPGSFKLCQGTMKAWCKIPRILSWIQAELSSCSKSPILARLSGVPTMLWLPCTPQPLPPCLFSTYVPH